MSRREKLRQNMLEDIKTIARQQMAENGTAAISLSAIARTLEVSQPALYRYYPSRDDLITALIVDAYNAQASALESAAGELPAAEELPAALEQPASSYAQRMLNVLIVYREWALEHPVEFQLIYGNPIPGYKAPFEKTAPAARRTFSLILDLLSKAYAAGQLHPRPEQIKAAERLIRLPALGSQAAAEAEMPLVIPYLGIMGWYHIHGMIMLELFHHTQELVPNGAAFYHHEVEQLLRDVGMEI